MEPRRAQDWIFAGEPIRRSLEAASGGRQEALRLPTGPGARGGISGWARPPGYAARNLRTESLDVVVGRLPAADRQQQPFPPHPDDQALSNTSGTDA